MGQLWQCELLFCRYVLQKNAGFQGNTLSDHPMTTGFGPFIINSQPMAYYRKGSTTSCLRLVFGVQLLVGIHSSRNIAKQIRGGAQWVKLSKY